MKQPKSGPQIYRMAPVTRGMSVLRTVQFDEICDQFKHFLSYLRLLIVQNILLIISQSIDFFQKAIDSNKQGCLGVPGSGWGGGCQRCLI